MWDCFLRLLQRASLAYLYLRETWAAQMTPGPTRVYFLGDSRDPKDYTVVPDDTVFVAEWVRGYEKRNVVRYAGETIPTEWTETPWTRNPKTPWVWVGDRETEIDLTRTFNTYLVVGNRITQDIVKKLIQVTDKTALIYIESGTFKELKFPGDGLTIQEYDDGPVQNSGPVHSTSEAVCAPVVGGHNGSSE